MRFDPNDLASGTGLKPALTVELQESNQDDDKDQVEEGGEERKENQVASDSLAAKQARRRACETEKRYVSDIRTLNDRYIVALDEKTHLIMEDAQIAVFVNSLRHLVMLNSKLLTDLQEIVDRSPVAAPLTKHIEKATASGKWSKRVKSPVAVAQCEAEGIGAVLCRYAALFKLYGGHTNDYEEVAALLQKFGRDAHLAFSSF